MRPLPFVFIALAAGALTVAAHGQEEYWIANRGSVDLNSVSQIGEVTGTVAVPTTGLRSAHVAPDGKIWVVRFIQPTVDIYNADGSPNTTISGSLGNPSDIAFDAAGHAWVSGGTGVEEFDANGTPVNTYVLGSSAPLGITVDAAGNKWIAHRVGPPGVLSKIDSSGTITAYSLPATSQILPTACFADRRGPTGQSHVWIVGDNRGAGELVDYDPTAGPMGTFTSYVLDPGGNLGSVVADMDPNSLMVQHVYVGDFRNGNIYSFDVATSTWPTPVVSVAPDVIGLNLDSCGRLWATTRGLTEVIRLNRTTLTPETISTVGSGVQSALSTRWEYVSTVDPFGDLDGDGDSNFIELQAGTSPFDPCSTTAGSLCVEDTASIGAFTSLTSRAPATSTNALHFAIAKSPVPITIPGIGCAVDLDPASIFPFVVFAPGTTTLPLTIPPTPGLVGTILYCQAINVNASLTLRFTNTTGWKFF